EAQPDTNQNNIAMSYTYQDNVTTSYNDLLIELNRSRELLEISQIENQQRFQFLEDQKKEINELLQKAYNDIIFT
ncbi:45135_t:CDS:1, partial [Gigaspora margarita]